MANTDNKLQDLLYLMKRLRDSETGCPWDLKQSFASIVPFTLEEVYEVVDTIEREDYAHLKEELGDLLFQVVFYSQLGEEQGLFDFEQVVSVLTEKLVSRHPHVFPDGTLHSHRDAQAEPDEQDIKQTWERLKQSERQDKGRSSILDDIPRALPALSRAQKLQKRAANHGFDWPDCGGVWNKLHEEIDELKGALRDQNQQNIEEELGDLLFTAVNLGRHLGVDSELALRNASRKFESRFQHLEEKLAESGEEVAKTSPQRLDQLWREAKLETG